VFLGCKPGTLLFVGTRTEAAYRAGEEVRTDGTVWQLEYLFLERAVKYAGETLTRLQEKRRDYDDACENCKKIAIKLCDELANHADVVANTREQLCTALHNKAIPSYVNLIEWEQLLAKDNPEKLKTLITEEVIAELRRFKQWVSIINHEKFLQDMGLSPSVVSKRTLSPFLQLLDDLSGGDIATIETMLRNTISELIEVGLKD